MSAVDVVTIPGAVIRDGLLFKANGPVMAWCDAKRGRKAVSGILGQAIGILRDGVDPARLDPMTDLIGGVIFFNHYDKNDVDGWSRVQATVVSEDISTARPTSVRGILSYAFDTLGVRLVMVEIDHSNTRSINSAVMLGFELCGAFPGAGSGGDDILAYGLLKQWCPFFAPEALTAMAAQKAYADGKTDAPWWRQVKIAA